MKLAPRLILLALSLNLFTTAAQAQDIVVPDEDAGMQGQRYNREVAPSLEQAIATYEAGDMDTAYKDFNRLAPLGDATAQFYLAFMMDKGIATASNPFAAVTWYRQSAEQDYLPAVTYLGYIYSIGHGVVKNDKESFKWYTRAAQLGSADAQNALGTMLRDGRAYKQDYQLASQWFLQSATQGNPRAQSNLAAMYFLGHGVKANLPVAIYWYNLAAKQKDVFALTALAAMARVGVGMDKDPVKALQYYTQAAELGHVPAQLALAKMYETGEGDKTKDASDAAVLYARAAKKGSPEAEARLGYFTENGIGLPQDIPAAVTWYNKASDANYMPAMMALAHLYEDGKGALLPPDIKKALSLYRACATAGDPEAEMKMGTLYKNGKGVTKSASSAYEWFALAAEDYPEGEDKHTALKNRIEMSNALTEEQLKQARIFLSKWKPTPLINQWR